MKLYLVLIFIVLIERGDLANIVSVYPTISRSHFLFVEPLFVELSRRGHNVTVFSEYATSKSVDSYTAVTLPGNPRLDEMVQIFTNNTGDKLMIIKKIDVMIDIINVGVEIALSHHEVRRVRNDGNVDLLITEGIIGDSLLALSIDFKCPTVQVASIPPLLDFYSRMGNPTGISYVPNTFLSFSSEPMDFRTRLGHYLIAQIENQFMYPRIRKLFTKTHKIHFPSPTYPSLYDLSRNVSLMLLNTHFNQGIVRPLVPGIVEVSGMHIEPAQPLRQDLRDFMNNSKNGVILFSLGTNLQSSSITPTQLEIILSTFRQLSENILWKFDKDALPGLPANVKIYNWLPQNDLLAHPNLKLFISHGGLGGIFEAKYNGVPLVLLPVYGDQMGNAELIVADGWGRSLKFDELAEREFIETIREVLTNESYRNRVQHLSNMYRDRPQSPMDTAVFWIEYVLRHKGAPHMQSHARNLNWFQLNSLDVIGFLLACVATICCIVFGIIRLIIRCLRNCIKVKRD